MADWKFNNFCMKQNKTVHLSLFSQSQQQEPLDKLQGAKKVPPYDLLPVTR